jgi:hypothetical protein
LNTVVPVETLRWVTFGQWEADESGALNRLAAAPHAELTLGAIGTMLSGNDQAIRPPRSLADGEVLDLGGMRVRWIDTPHVPHGWDAGLLFEETTGTLLCGDLFAQTGDASITTGDIVGPAVALEDKMNVTSLTPRTAPTIRRLADLRPSTMALMHGPFFRGDCAPALLAWPTTTSRASKRSWPPSDELCVKSLRHLGRSSTRNRVGIGPHRGTGALIRNARTAGWARSLT